MRRLDLLVLLYVVLNWTSAMDGAAYGHFAVLPYLSVVDTERLVWWMHIALWTSTPVAVVCLLRIGGPIARAVDALARGETPDPALLATARRRAVNLPALCVRLALLIWAAAAPTVFLARPPLLVGIHCVLITLVVGAASGMPLYYLAELYSRKHFIPVLVPDGRLGAIPGTISISLRRKIGWMLLTCCGIPVALLTFAAVTGRVDARAVGVIGVIFVCLAVLQGLAISRSVSRPLHELAAAMVRVKRADLGVTVPVVSVDAVGQVAEGFNEMVAGLRQAEYVKETFGQYVTPEVRDEILAGRVKVGGEQRVATVMFSDIRGFTALSERLPAAEVVRFLNRWLEEMVGVVVEHGGTVDKFIGDAVMASFGVPLTGADDARSAVRAAVAMVGRLEAWNAERAAAGEPPLDIGIGLHTGAVVAGEIGSAKKKEYTVIGDTVNTAARIEQLNKQLGTRILISAQTHAEVADAVLAEPRGPQEVKGKSQPLVVYEVTGLRVP